MVNLDFNFGEDELEQLEQQEEKEIAEKKKKKRPAFFLIAIVALLLGLLGLGGWVLYDKSQKQSEWMAMQMQFDSSKNVLKEEYNTVLQKMDSLSSNGLDFKNELEAKRKEFDNLTGQMDRIVREKDNDLNAAREKIQELRTRIQELTEDVEALKKQQEELIARKKAGLIEMPGDTVVVNTHALQFDQVTGKPAVYTSESVRGLKVTDMQVVSVTPGGTEKTDALSKYTSGIKVSFMLDKDATQPSGNRELQLVLSCPNGTAGAAAASGASAKDPKAAANASGVNGVQKVYTVKTVANYDKKKGAKVEYTWTPPTRLNSGDYKVEVYCQGSKLAEKTMLLKRGTKAFPF